MAPKVLVSDKLSETAVQIFRDRGIDVDFMPDLGKDKDKLAELIGQYDGLAIRSATKVTPTILEAATNLKVVARAGIGTDNVDKEAASKKALEWITFLFSIVCIVVVAWHTGWQDRRLVCCLIYTLAPTHCTLTYSRTHSSHTPTHQNGQYSH